MENEQPLASVPMPQPIYCPQCHQPVSVTAYFCPNCGKKLNEPALSTGVGAQFWLYAFSIILPFIAYLAITYWQGIKYARSNNPRTREIGWIAIVLMAASTIITFWIAAVWINQTLQASLNSLNVSGL